MLNPSITPTRGSQPGYTTMTYDGETDTISNVQMTFLQLDSAYGLAQDAHYSDFEYLYVDYDEDFGLQNLSGQDISELNQRLVASDSLYSKYIANKMGFTESYVPSIDYYNCLQM